jgi:hypothetical protein
MKSKPVRKYAQPEYPTRLEVAAHPGLLHRHQPPAWRKWPELTGAAALFLLADATRLSAAEKPPKGSQNLAQTNAVAIVAPIFEHGAGRGATGCIVMSPPAFLSEEEALQVIREEMAAKGVKLGTNQTLVAGITVERVVWPVPVAPTGATKVTKPAGPTFQIKQEPLKADAADPKKKVFVEFLSERDGDRWDGERSKEEGTRSWGSVRSYDLRKTAAYVAKKVKRQATDKLYFGAFYDPLAGTLDLKKRVEELLAAGVAMPTNQAIDAKVQYLGNGKTAMMLSQPADPLLNTKSESRRLLRLQVQDFLEWLQAQGAI